MSLVVATQQRPVAPDACISLRPYQAESIRAVYEEWQAGNRRVMLQLPTGTGKTVVFAAIAYEFLLREKRVLVLAHREELVLQAKAKIESVSNMSVGLIKSGYSPEPSRQVQVASVQTLINRLHLVRGYDLVIVDEAHHSTAESYRAILDALPGAAHLGVTATPIRADGKGFRDVFDVLVVGPTVRSLIKDGYLAQPRLFASENPMSTKGVRKRGGDYRVSDLARENDVVELAANLVDSYRERCDGERCIIFAINREHSQAIAGRYLADGIPAAHLDGTTPPDVRKRALDAFASGQIRVISNCELFTEGVDIPAAVAVQIARPTASLSFWLQMVGRVLRPAPGKEHAIILDHTDNWATHGLPQTQHVWSLDECRTPRLNLLLLEGEVVEGTEKKEDEQLKPIIEVESDPLKEITDDPEIEKWLEKWNDLVKICEERQYKRGWLAFRLKEIAPPLEIWQLCAAYIGFKKGWAWHMWKGRQMDTISRK